MMKNRVLHSLGLAGIALLAVFLPLLGQGTMNQEYSGLDKYLTQGIPNGKSFVGVRAAEFLTIPVGARGIAMGSAYSALADDITSIWWNPAGLGFLEKNEVMLTVVDYTMNLTYSYAAAAVPILDGRLVLGGFFGYLDIPEMLITTIDNPNGTGRTFSAYDFQGGGSLAYNLSDRFVAGLNLKMVHQEVLSNIGGSAFAIDAGSIYHTDFMGREIKFAFTIQNLGTNITMTGPNLLYESGPQTKDNLLPSGYEDYSTNPNATSRRGGREVFMRTHTYRLPTIVKLALAYNLVTTEKANLVASGELWKNSNIPISYSMGSEMTYSISPHLSGSLQVGWKVQTDEYTEASDDFGYEYLGDDPTWRGFSAGGGIKRDFGGRSISFNYAYRNKGRLTADNFFTVTFGF